MILRRLALFWVFGIGFSLLPFMWVRLSGLGLLGSSWNVILGDGELYPLIVALGGPALGALLVMGFVRRRGRSWLALFAGGAALAGVTSAAFLYDGARRLSGDESYKHAQVAHISVRLFILTMVAVTICMAITRDESEEDVTA